jgi:transposase
MHLMRQRAELLAHVQNTNRQYHLPAIRKNIADKANRDGLAERFAAPALQKNIEIDLALIGPYAQRLNDVEVCIVPTAKQHDPQTVSRRQSVPGLGKRLSLVLLYAIHDLQRFPRVQDFVSSCRLGKCTKASAGKRYGTAGAKLGNAYLKWAFAEAAVLFLRNNPAGQKYLTKLENKHGKGQALPSLAPKLARAVYDLLKRQTAFAMPQFLSQ